MGSFLLSSIFGFALGVGFVELTHKLTKKGLLGLYIISLPLKLSLWAFALYISYTFNGLLSFMACLFGFLLGFLFTLIFRGYVKDGRPKDA
ncbi:MAG: hypothetical protein ACK4ZR_01100 [Aquificaceae bacterium]